MTDLRVYATVCAFVGVLGVLDGLILWQKKGRPNALTFLIGTVETLWAIVSLYVAFKAWRENSLIVVLALLYCAYTVIVMLEGAWAGARSPDAGPVMNIPPLTVLRGVAFGAAFFLFSLYVLARLGVPAAGP